MQSIIFLRPLRKVLDLKQTWGLTHSNRYGQVCFKDRGKSDLV